MKALDKTKTEAAATQSETKNSKTVRITSEESNFGLIAYTVSAELTDEQIRKEAGNGLLYGAQRGPASRTEKSLAGYKKSRSEMGTGWTRKDLGYSPELAANFAESMVKEILDCYGIRATVTTGEYVPEARDIKYSVARATVVKAIAAKSLAKLVSRAGFKGELGVKPEDNVELLAAVHAAIEAAKSQLFS